MRTWVLIAALAVICLAAEKELSHKETIRNVLKSWNSNSNKHFFEPIREQKYRTTDESDLILDTHHISKRSVAQPHFLAGMATRGCNLPGYTGETCQYPLCMARNPYVPNDVSSDDVAIDGVNLANCTETYIIVVDETMWDIKIELETESPLNPTFYLQAENGDLISPDSDSQRPTQYRATYIALAPGQYLLGPRADTGNQLCTMLMTSRSYIKVSGGFTSGSQAERSDYPTLKFAYFDTESVVAVHAQGLEFPGQIQAIGFTGAENHISRYIPIGTRYNCTYPYVLERYTCRKTSNNDVGFNFFQVEGISNAGYKFRRIVSYQCVLPPVVTTTAPAPTTPAAPITSCQNGGQLLKDASGNPYCYCFGMYSGNDCSQMLCANGGFLPTPTSERCECPEGFSGFHCTNIICTDTSGFDFNAENPTLTLVIRSRTQLSAVIENATQAVTDIVDLLSSEPGYLTNFIVVLFDNGKLLVNKRYSSWDAAMVDLTKAIHSVPSDGGCDDVVFSAVASALSLYPTNKSPVYIITDANPNDSSEKETVFHLESYWRAPLYFIYVQPAPGDGCNTSPDNSGYRDMTDVAARSGGNTFYFNDRSTISTFFYQHMFNTLFRSQLILSGDYSHCTNQNVYKSAAIDLTADLVVVVATGTNLTLFVTSPTSDRPTFDIAFTDGVNYIWTYNKQVSGQWFFNLLSTSPNSACTFKVYQKKFNFGGLSQYSPDYDVFWSFATTLTSAAGILRQPVLGFDASPVFHVANYPAFISMDRVHANLQIYAIRDGLQTEVYGSSGMWRDGCEFNFYFTPFTCRVPDEILYFNFFARDNNDMTLQRAGTMYCASIHPTPPPDHQCQNGGVMNPANTTCFCTPEWTGTYCTDIVCYNGGTPAGDHCVCSPGYAGESCELARCIETGPNPEFIRYGVDMVFAVEITQNSLASIVVLNTKFQEIIRDVIMQDRGWIRNFVLVGYNSTWGGPIAVSPANNLTAITNALQNLATNVPTDTGCTVKLWDALNHALFSGDLPPGSFVEIFQTTPEDDTDTRSLGLFYDMSRSLDIVLYGFLSTIPRLQPSGFVCNATIENYYTLLGIVSGSTGTTYTIQPAEISNAIRLIPLQFSNGQVNFNYEDDCRHDNGMITYFPVDAYTQTIQIETFGYGTTLQVFSGDGVLAEALELFYDDFTGQSVYEVRKACDDGWDALGQYCMKFLSFDDVLPMPQARNFCASAGGYLVDDMAGDTNSFLYSVSAKTQFWIGLFKNSDGQFYWDRGQGLSPDPLNQAKTYWADGQPSNDPVDQCVYFDGRATDPSKVWVTESCSVPRAFACQKHRYDANKAPNTLGEDELQPGHWYAFLKSNPGQGKPNMCTMSVRVQSSLQIIAGYTTSVGSDMPQPDPIQDSPNNMLITYVHSVDNENRAPILTDAILWDAYNGTFYNGLKYQPRFACQYGWVSQNFPCPNGDNQANEFGVLHVGQDEFGNTFQRLTYGHCSRAEITCGNGGIRQNGVCVCTEYWTGSRCTVPICVNGGTRNSDQATCNCTDGYAGQNCQFELCQPNIPQLFSNNRKTLLMVVETTRQNSATVNQLITNLTSIVTSATSSVPLWFTNFGLVTFDSTGRTFENFNYTNINDLVTDLTTQSNAISTDGACSLPYLGVLAHLLEHDDVIAMPNSEIFLVTAAGPSDLDKYVETMDTLFNTQAHLHYVVSKSANCPTFDGVNNVRDMTWLGYGSSGNILFTDSVNIATLLNSYLPSLYGASVLQDPTGITNYDCSDGTLPWFVPVDINTTFIYVTTSSEFGSLSIKDPLGYAHTVAPLYNVNDQKLYQIEVNRVGGIWTLQLVSPPGLCLAHVYSTGGAKVYTKFALPNPVGGKADPLGSHQDGMMVQPVAGFDNVAVFHLAGDPFHTGQLQYVEIFDIGDTTATNVLRSELYRRFDCSYEYYSDLFTCNGDMIAVFVHGVDENNQKFRRQEIVVCNGRAPPTQQPPTGTIAPITQPTQGPVTQATQGPVTQPTQQPPVTGQTGQTGPIVTTQAPLTALQFDVVFLIDGSQSAQTSFNSLTKFVQTFMVSFNVGVNNARVGLIVVAPDLDDQPPPAAQLNSITSQASLISNLNLLKDNYADFDHAGQLLTENLQVVTSADYMSASAGYRSNINNHVLIYITTTTSFNSDPVSTAQTILAQKQYGIITIGFGTGFDNSKLQAVSGGAACSFTAPDFASLNNQIRTIQQLVVNANMNGGNYCTNN
uniref:EGF-like domain-containing protein n=1 Tax=Caenorhabditis tropicalis TaxID=1561998 RepID=A0A1I7UAH2_9PELO